MDGWYAIDQLNMEAYLRILNKPSPNFLREIAPKVLLVGLGSVLFRDAPFTSHEVVIDEAQIKWFEKLATTHKAEDGWRIFVFSHAPPMGSGLRVLQENHVVNGCCWLNHSSNSLCSYACMEMRLTLFILSVDGDFSRKFIQIVRENASIKGSCLCHYIFFLWCIIYLALLIQGGFPATSTWAKTIKIASPFRRTTTVGLVCSPRPA